MKSGRWARAAGRVAVILAGVAGLGSARAAAQGSFVNWETPHVSPLDISPDGTRLFAVNTPDNRLEVFDITGATPLWLGSVPVGLDPVSVRARSNNEVWVVNHVSDNFSVVDVATRNVIRTVNTGDEPCDVVFAGSPERAFVTCSQLNQVKVYDPADLSIAPVVLNIEGEDPRALTVDPVAGNVYVAIFESGNGTTAADRNIVSDLSGPYGGSNPPPNSGENFNPPQLGGNPAPPAVALILKRDYATNEWKDDNNHVWSDGLVPWKLHDHDVAVIDANTLTVGYISHLMNLDMALTVRPDGRVVVVGMDAINHIRFEPNLRGRFVKTLVAIVDPTNSANDQIVDLNPHLATAYANNLPSVDPGLRYLSISDPRGVVWKPDGTRGYVAGMGSNNVVVIDANGQWQTLIDVGGGPTGLRLDATGRLFVLNKFDASIYVIDTATDSVTATTALFDPTPDAIKAGRPFLYDTHLFGGLGVTSCGSCHIDARMDQLGWDLGDPSGAMKTFNQVCQLTGQCSDWHPMKGPTVTQTLVNIVGTEPLHWRGDRENLAAFSGAFVSLLGSDFEPTAPGMAAFEAFLATIKSPPNPYRNTDNSLKSVLGDGNALAGQTVFLNTAIDTSAGNVTCNNCHTQPDGTSGKITPLSVLAQTQNLKNPQMRNLYEKTGFSKTSQNNNRGFGYTHDGTTESLVEFLMFSGFNFATMQQRRDMAAYLLSFSTDTHAGVGIQVTFNGANNGDASLISQTNLMVFLANNNATGLVVKGRQGGIERGYRYNGANIFQSDRTGETITKDTLRAAASAGNELTWTIVPKGTETRIAIDRDLDGHFDRTEIEGCGDPANALVGPGHFLNCDSNCDGLVNNFDIDAFIEAVLSPSAYAAAYATCNYLCNNDINRDGFVNNFDIDPFVNCILTQP